ncbi:hypothetical protein [Oleiharenicola lentus]|uniref:hypothetical protein n=1 Tax=Oleiharenicola lentus TaxID=2508720 RepID=UPI003F668A7C
MLIIIAFASMMLARMIELSSTDLLIAMRVADRDRLRGDARSALETTLAVLEDFRAVDQGLFAPEQGWGDPLTYANYTPREGLQIAVTFEDESAKLSLPRMNLDSLTLLLSELGLADADAERVADAMMVWMHKEHIAGESATSATVYLQDELSHIPPQRSLRSFDELADIVVAKDFFYDKEGRRTPLWDAFVQSVSLYDFETSNLNAASAAVLMASGWDETQVDSLTRHRTAPKSAVNTPPYLRTLDEARTQVGNAESRNLGTEILCLRVNVVVQQGAAQFKLSALVARKGQVKLPPPMESENAPEPAATGEQAPASPTTAARQGTNTAGNTIQYPFTILELTETSLPDAVTTPDPAPNTAPTSR